MENKFINFKYNKINYILEISEYGLESELEVNYDNVCQYERYQDYDDEDSTTRCDHEYNRCMIIINIEKGEFNLHGYLNYYLTTKNENSPNDKSEVIELIKNCWSSINFADYIDCSSEGDYYGENLVKKLYGLNNLIEEMIQNLKSNKDFKNISLK